MWSVKLQVPDTATSSIARYFSEQPATPAKDGGATAAAGKKLYESAKPGTPSCQSCHGERGEGKGTVPRLAGQHAEYLITQMWVFNFMLRTSDTMHHNVQSMTDQQIKAVASYLASD
jgi:cytochrome c553